MNKHLHVYFRFVVLLALLCINVSVFAQTYTFTNAGAVGRFGPTQSDVNSAYNNTNLANQVTVNNGIQQWVVPQSGWYTINVCGAQGGNTGISYTGGLGACMQGDFFLAQGTILNILVGQQGEASTYNTGGGGGSFIWINGQTTEPLIAAGGGGGAGYSNNGVDADTSASGTNGTGSAGTPGTGGNGATPGGGGWKSVGGNYNANTSCAVKCTGNQVGVTVGGATPLTTIVYHGCAGSSQTGDGGFGGASGGNGNCTSSHGGGGGGGYSGGVGQSGSSAGGGGGGSYNSGTNQVNIPGFKTGHGEIVINFIGGSTPNNAGITTLPSLSGTACPGPLPVTARIVNFGNNLLDSVYVNWSVNGVLQTGQWFVFNPSLDTAGSNNNDTIVTIGSFTLAANTPTTIKAWTSLPNNVADTLNSNDTASVTIQAAMGGNYTINSSQPSSGSNYTSFTSFINAVSQAGICSPIVVNVSGSYNEQVEIQQIPGSSATNTITFRGVTGLDTLKSGGSSTNYATLNLDGADYLTFKNMVIEATSTTGNFAVHLMNDADYNTFDSCVILVNPAATVSTTAGVSMSASATSYSSAGSNGSHNTFSNSTIVGGYFGFVFYGNSASNNVNNSIINCNIQDFYLYGTYNLQQSGATISNNVIERPTRSTVTTFYGVMLSTGCNNMLVEKNIIRNAGGASGTASFTAYCIYNSSAATVGNENKIINNIIYNIGNTGTIAGIYMPSGTHVQVYHNTIVLNNTSATSGTVYGVYSTGSAGVDIKNNNIYITQGGSGVKYGMYFSSAGKSSDHNNIFVNSPDGQNNTGYYLTLYPTLLAWQGANSNAWDQNSLEVNPVFANLATGNLTPGNSLLDDMGTPVGVTTDITGAARSTTTPDIGALEFSVPPCFGTPVAGTAAAANNATSACLGSLVDISLTGFTLGAGITIEWEKSPAGAGSWTPIAGATTGFLTDTFTAATDYRAVVTCVNGGGFDISNTVSINVSPFYVCYCSPLTGVQLQTSSGTNYMTNVSIANTTLNSTTTSVGAGGYLQLPHTVSTNTATLAQGIPYTLEVTTSSTAANSEAWIDWDMNGTFDSTEYIPLSTGGTLKTGTILIPTSAMTGLTGLRVRNVYSSTTFHGPTGACSSISLARETEDYVITIAPAPSCMPAGVPVATTITATTGVFEWNNSLSNPANGYEWRVFTAGNGPSGTPVASGAEIAGDTIANVSGLSAITNYTFFVRAICSGGNSLWTSVNFTTPCAALPAPWYDSVESQNANTNSVMINCWSSDPTNTTSLYRWNVDASGSTPSANTGPSGAFSGTNYFYVEASNGVTNDTASLYTPQINVSTLTNPMLEFYYHMYGSTINKLVVSVHNGTTWNNVDSIIGQQQTSLNDPWLKRSVYLTGYTGIIQIKFTAHRGTSFYGDISLDDISVTQAPSCPTPTNPTATASMTGATLNWTENGSATLWQIEYGSANFAPGSGTSVFVSSTSKPYLLTGLTHSTEYSYFVRAICGPNDTSAWSVRKVFATIPINDSCASAINIGNGLPVTGTTAGATQSLPAGSCAASTLYANDVWYYFSVGNTPGNVTVTAVNTVGDVVLEVLSGTCGMMTEVDCEDVPAIGTETITLTNPAAGIYYVRVYGFQSIENPFTIQVTGSPLAIKLADISATNEGSRNRVDWKTADEKDGDKFILERSADGKLFRELHTIQANGIASAYRYWDEQPLSGTNYYRLKMQDKAGNITYSESVSAIAKGLSVGIEVFPNPADNQITIAVKGGIHGHATITITDVSGKIVRTISGAKTENVINMEGLAAGTYLVNYADDQIAETVRIQKK